MYYFLEEDFKALEKRQAELEARLRDWGQEMGVATTQSSETWHDNYPYEEARRQFEITASELSELLMVKSQAHVVAREPNPSVVKLGSVVTYEDENGNLTTIEIGGYLIQSKNGRFSYDAPLVKFLLGARVGEKREGEIGGKTKTFTITAIS